MDKEFEILEKRLRAFATREVHEDPKIASDEYENDRNAIYEGLGPKKEEVDHRWKSLEKELESSMKILCKSLEIVFTSLQALSDSDDPDDPDECSDITSVVSGEDSGDIIADKMMH